MKKQVLLFAMLGAFGYVTLTSESNGPAAPGNGNNKSGAKGSPITCGAGGCHGTGTGTTVSIEVDSTGSVPVTAYVPGMSYTVKITGSNTASLAKFGFQYAVVSGTGASQVQAGSCSGLPANVASHSLSGLNFIEHTSPLSGTAGAYSTSFSWTAPTTGVGDITMYCTLNAVNGNGNADNADVSGNVNKVLTQHVTKPVSVASVANDVSVTAFPNPTTGNLNVQLTNAAAGTYAMQAFDMNGKCVAADNIIVSGASQAASINTASWAPGMYHVVISVNGANQVIPVVKK